MNEVVKISPEELQDFQLEQFVIYSMLNYPEIQPMIAEMLPFAECFYFGDHKIIWSRILKEQDESGHVDLVSIYSKLMMNGEIKMMQNQMALTQANDCGICPVSKGEYFAELLKQIYQRREIIKTSREILDKSMEAGASSTKIIEFAEESFYPILEMSIRGQVESMDSLAMEVMKEAELASQSEEGLTGIPSGFSEMDRLTNGWQDTDLIIVAARPAMGKCLGKGTKVLMFDGSLKSVEDVVVGDQLMGVDSKPRNVLSICRGKDKMYWVRQLSGIDYRVNSNHVLSLKKSRTEGRGSKGDVLNISVKDYLSKSNKWKTNYKGYKSPIEFKEDPNLPLEPYFLGVWLGDGSCNQSEVTNPDYEIIEYMSKYAERLNKPFVLHARKSCPELIIKGNQKWSIRGELNKLHILSNKSIPQKYLINSKENRLQLLAGLLDSDGYYYKEGNTFEITVKQKLFSQQIKFLCDSLGFKTSLVEKIGTIKSRNFSGLYYRVRISGNISIIPTKIKRKQAREYGKKRDWRVTGVTVEFDKVDDYYGFELDGDHLFLLEDMTVTHNSSYVCCMAKNAAEFDFPIAIFSCEMSAKQIARKLISIESEIPTRKIESGKMEDYEWQQLQNGIEKCHGLPIYVDETPGINITDLRTKARKLAHVNGVKMIIVDYLQLMTSSAGGNREQEISDISRKLKGIAKELSVPVIALSQLSRAVETRGGSKRPQLSDLRESGAIEQDADVVQFIYRPEYYSILEDEEGQSLKGVAEIITAKNRHGELRTVKLKFNGSCTKFTDLEDPNFNDLMGIEEANLSTQTSVHDMNNTMRNAGKKINDEDIPF